MVDIVSDPGLNREIFARLFANQVPWDDSRSHKIDEFCRQP